MDSSVADDDLLIELIVRVAEDVLQRLGDDRDARFQFFKRLVVRAKEITHAAAPEASTTRQ